MIYKIKDKDNNEYKAESLREFCEEMNIGVPNDEHLTPRLLRYTHPKEDGRIKTDGSEARYQKWHRGFRIDGEVSEEKYQKEIMSNAIELGGTTILAIGDLHAPFTHKGYLQFCKDVAKHYNPDVVIFMGDIMDNHYSSYHETDPGGYNADDEFDIMKEQIGKFYKAFPNAKVCLGNHDQIILRKFKTAGLSKNWVKSFQDTLGVPGWDFQSSFKVDGKFFYHGVGRKPKLKARDSGGISCVAGHYHSDTYIVWYENENGHTWFGMQIGTGVDKNRYAFDYAKHGKTPQMNVGIIQNGIPTIIPYSKREVYA